MLMRHECCGLSAGSESYGSGNLHRQTECSELDDQVNVAVSGRAAGRRRTKPNNGMHPTGESANVRRKVECLSQCFPAGDAGR